MDKKKKLLFLIIWANKSKLLLICVYLLGKNTIPMKILSELSILKTIEFMSKILMIFLQKLLIYTHESNFKM